MFDLKTPVLVVDDILTMRKIVSKAVKELGFTTIVEMSDGQKGWDAITNAATPFGLVISDWNMPNCTGLDLLKRVRADARNKSIPFVMLTAESEAHQVAEAVKAGVDNYIIKPFTADTLRKKLEETYQRVSKRGAA